MHRGCAYYSVGFGHGSGGRQRSPDFRDLLGDRENFVLEVLLDPLEPAFEFLPRRRDLLAASIRCRAESHRSGVTILNPWEA